MWSSQVKKISKQKKRETEKLSWMMAMILGVLLTLEIMVGGAMVLDMKLQTIDGLALVFAFVVVYFGVVALLTDQ